MNYALLTNNKLTGLVITEGIMNPPLGAQASMPAGMDACAPRDFLRRSMKKIFACLTLAAFMLGGATAFAQAQDPAGKTMAKTSTSHKRKSKRKRHHASATNAAAPSAAAPKKK
jgi:hypothetical protein